MVKHIISQKLIVIFTVVFSIVLGIGLAFNPAFPLWYSDSEHMNALYAKGFFDSPGILGSPGSLTPIQNINLLSALIIRLGHQIPIASNLILWIGQSLLVYLFFWRYAIFVKRWAADRDPLPDMLILAIHPLVWRVLLFSPSLGLTALLLLEVLIRIPQETPPAVSWYFSLLALSFSGIIGFTASVFIFFLLPIIHWIKNPEGTASKSNFIPYIKISLPAILPAFGFYFLLTIESGIAGGAYLSNYPTLFSVLSVSSFFTGEWSEHFRSLLLGLASGYAEGTYSFPLFGIGILLGCIEGMTAGRSESLFCVIYSSFLIFFLFLFAFAPMDTAREWQFFFLPVSIYMFSTGIHGFARCKMLYQQEIVWISAALIGILSLASFSQIMAAPSERAQYHRHLQTRITAIVNDPAITDAGLTAIRFEPWIYSQLPGVKSWIPYDLSITCRLECPWAIYGGFRWDLGKVLSLAPKNLLRFPSYAEVKHEKISVSETEKRWDDILLPFYTKTLNGNLEILEFQPKNSVGLQEKVKQKLMEESHPEDFDLAFSAYADFPDANPGEVPAFTLAFADIRQRVGMSWTFESHYENLRRIGTAFGFSPSDRGSAVGVGCAGPPSGEGNHELGILQSVPFVLEGNELGFFADIPKAATASLFCLATPQQVPIGENQAVKEIRHVFDHQPGASLLGEVYYTINPSLLNYSEGKVNGWRVIYAIHGGEMEGGCRISWNTEPWINQPAVWLAADRNPQYSMRVDHIVQRKRISQKK